MKYLFVVSRQSSYLNEPIRIFNSSDEAEAYMEHMRNKEILYVYYVTVTEYEDAN